MLNTNKSIIFISQIYADILGITGQNRNLIVYLKNVKSILQHIYFIAKSYVYTHNCIFEFTVLLKYICIIEFIAN